MQAHYVSGSLTPIFPEVPNKRVRNFAPSFPQPGVVAEVALFLCCPVGDAKQYSNLINIVPAFPFRRNLAPCLA